VLDTSTFRHVGGTSEIKVDVRVLAATNRDLPGMVKQGLFREDLYYRLSTVPVVLPPLRDRGSDIDLLARHFAARLGERFGVEKRLSSAALQLLRRHHWPGNVRELFHAIEAAIVVCEGTEVQPEHLPAQLRAPAGVPAASSNGNGELQTLEALERAAIERALRHTHGHRGQAAKVLGISERNLYRKLREYGFA
jgi:DNA-binding NtrC family response regulator